MFSRQRNVPFEVDKFHKFERVINREGRIIEDHAHELINSHTIFFSKTIYESSKR